MLCLNGEIGVVVQSEKIPIKQPAGLSAVRVVLQAKKNGAMYHLLVRTTKLIRANKVLNEFPLGKEFLIDGTHPCDEFGNTLTNYILTPIKTA